MTDPKPLPEADPQAIAERIIYAALGKRWVRPHRAVDVYPIQRDVFLTGRPVIEIFSVTMSDGSVLSQSDYEISGRFRLRLSAAVWSRYVESPIGSIYGRTKEYYGDPFEAAGLTVCGPREMTVDYSYGSQPNDNLLFAISTYAKQLELALCGSDDCKLPKRVTNVSRQGVSLTILDPMDFLEKGLTGVPEVDSVLRTFNPVKAKARARVFTDKNPPARRISVQAL